MLGAGADPLVACECQSFPQATRGVRDDEHRRAEEDQRGAHHQEPREARTGTGEGELSGAGGDRA